jgi:dephospho-CoA kinase
VPESSPNALRVGLTGGIASGKTLVSGLFAALDVAVIDTDEIARAMVGPGSEALGEIVAAFGRKILTTTGELDRSALRQLIFSDANQRQRLDSIMHPRIGAEALLAAAAAPGPYQILVAPLLIEARFTGYVDRILVVDCPEELQRERLLRRDNEDSAQVDRILAAQLSRTERVQAANDIIDNSGSRDETRRQVRVLHEKYLSLTPSR